MQSSQVWNDCKQMVRRLTVCWLPGDTMDDWDEAMLNDVVNKKHGESNSTKPQTSIVSLKMVSARTQLGPVWSVLTGPKKLIGGVWCELAVGTKIKMADRVTVLKSSCSVNCLASSFSAGVARLITS